MTTGDLADRDRRIGQLAARLGEQFALGALLRTTPGPRFPPLWIAGILLLLGDLFGFVLVLIGADTPYSALATLAVIVVVAGVGLLGWLLIRSVGPLPMEYVFWYEQGVVHQFPDGTPPTVVRWTEVTTVTAQLSSDPDGAPFPVVGLALHAAGPTSLELGARFRSQGLTWAYANYARSQGPRRTLPLIEAYQRGETVFFGDLGISQQGVSRSTGVTDLRFPMAWGEISHIVLSGVEPGEELTICPAGAGWFGGINIGLSRRPDAALIYYLLQHVADRSGLRLLLWLRTAPVP